MGDLPPDLARALLDAGLTDFFAGCTDAHRGKCLKWIGEAKRRETRKARIEKALTVISAKRAQKNARRRPTS